MTLLTLTTIVVVVYGAISRGGYGRALALGGATPVGAALVFGAVALPTFYACAAGAAAGLAVVWLTRLRDPDVPWPPVPAGRTLVCFLLLALVVTLTAPLLFPGLVVQAPSGPAPLVAGAVTKSNLAQVLYVALSVAVVFFVARSETPPWGLVGLAACTTTVLSYWAWLGISGVPFPVGLFDNSPAFTFQNTLPGGGVRVRGIMSEPAGLATSSLVTVAYAVARLRHVSRMRQIALVLVMGMAVHLGTVSTSATFYVAGAGILVVAAIVHGTLFFSGRTTFGAAAVVGVSALVIAGIWLLPVATAALGDVVDDKVGSASYDERSGADSTAYDLVWRTAGLGVGLGANRASSLVATLLSTVGIVGAALLVGAIGVLLRDAWAVREARPSAWALVALLVTKCISGPDLADTSGILWISLGVLAHAALLARGRLVRTDPVAGLQRPLKIPQRSDVTT